MSVVSNLYLATQHTLLWTVNRQVLAFFKFYILRIYLLCVWKKEKTAQSLFFTKRPYLVRPMPKTEIGQSTNTAKYKSMKKTS